MLNKDGSPKKGKSEKQEKKEKLKQLFDAIKIGDTAKFKTLFSREYVNSKYKFIDEGMHYDVTLLFWAIKHKQFPIVILLLVSGASPNTSITIQNQPGTLFTAVLAAVVINNSHEYDPFILQMIRNQADITTVLSNTNLRQGYLNFLCRNKEKMLGVFVAQCELLMQAAIQSNDLNLVEILITNYFPNKERNAHFIDYAVRCRSINVLEKLINFYYDCPLVHWAFHQYLLLKSKSLSAKERETPAYLFQKSKNLTPEERESSAKTTREIIMRRKKLINELHQDASLLHSAVLVEETEFVKFLLNIGADPNIKTKDQVTPLYFACEGNRLAILELLLEKGANPNQLCALPMYQCPLYVAQALRQYGCNEETLKQFKQVRARMDGHHIKKLEGDYYLDVLINREKIPLRVKVTHELRIFSSEARVLLFSLAADDEKNKQYKLYIAGIF
ncbi:MAG: ankyrin repeat domain-containing protein [Gammaproteobacteria bacterium]